MAEKKNAVPIGLKDLYYAKLIKDDETGVQYDTPKKIAPAISASVSPTVNSATLYADNGPIVTANSLGEITVEINPSDIPFDVQVDLLGQTINEDGVIIDNAEDQAPEVALGFRRTTSAGTSRLVWLLKGKFSLPTEEAQTQGDTPEFQTPTITGVFIKRMFDGNWRYRLDTGMETANQDVATAWFSEVYDPTIPNP